MNFASDWISPINSSRLIFCLPGFASEYRALARLPGIDGARVWEPEPATVYSWGGRKHAA